jgi:hypothetical protein
MMSGGCAEPYKNIVRPVPKMSLLSPELENLSDFKVETYLTADARPVFPTTLAVAKMGSSERRYYRSAEDRKNDPVEMLRGVEAEGWRSLPGDLRAGGTRVLEQVQLVSPLVAPTPVTLKGLRDAAALLHAPLLFVYVQDDQSSEGYNDAAMAYWTLVGLFVVPGHTVGHYTVCQGVLVDTRSGFILATAEGEALREENVLPGAVEIASDRVRREAQVAAVVDLQTKFRETLVQLAVTRGVFRDAAPQTHRPIPTCRPTHSRDGRGAKSLDARRAACLLPDTARRSMGRLQPTGQCPQPSDGGSRTLFSFLFRYSPASEPAPGSATGRRQRGEQDTRPLRAFVPDGMIGERFGA